MKGFLLTVFGVVLIATLGFAYTGAIESFTARPDGDVISIEWKSASETGIQSYAVERSDVRFNDFQEIGTIKASGSYSYYKFKDGHINAAPLTNQSGAVKPLADMFKYRLRMNLANEVSYSQTISVTRPSSGVRRTWGMIKEMFH
jgi:hypothetical protein